MGEAWHEMMQINVPFRGGSGSSHLMEGLISRQQEVGRHGVIHEIFLSVCLPDEDKSDFAETFGRGVSNSLSIPVIPMENKRTEGRYTCEKL